MLMSSLVFSGYFIFYLLILINKQFLAFQVNLLKEVGTKK